MVGYAALTGEREMHREFLWGKLKEREHIKDLDVNRMIILT
jgi:hypothetical protein